MKLILPVVLGLACIALIAWLVVTKQESAAQREQDAGAIAGFSNRLDLAEMHVAMNNGAALIFSNSLSESRSLVLTFSNQFLEAQAAVLHGTEQVTNLNRLVAEGKAENQTLGRRIMDLTNQLAGLTGKLALTEASLVQTNADLIQLSKDYALLENRFRIDVAERTVVERKFNNPAELAAQLKKLKNNPAGAISAESIYAGLNVEMKSNGWCHVIAPN